MLSCLPELGAVLFAIAGELVWVPANQVEQNPFAPQCTHESVQTDLDEIGTVEQWTTKYRRMCGHGASMMESVAHLLTEGVKQWNLVPTMEAIYSRYPGATPATWWIIINSENNDYKKLYSKLASCTPGFHPYVWTGKTTRDWAVAHMRVVQAEMREEGRQWLMEQYETYDAYASGAGRTDG